MFCRQNINQKNFICYIVMVIIFVFICMRSFFGFDWSDEAFYPTGPYGLLVGKELFKDYWSVSQFGYVITLPFIFLYRIIFGDMDGVMLFLRMIYNLFNLIIAIYTFNVFKRVASKIILTIVGACIIIFAPFSVGTFSYNSFSLQFLLLSGILIASYIYKKNRLTLVLSGLAYGFAVQLYPGIIFSIFIIPIYLLFKKENYDIEDSGKKRLMLWIIGGIIVVALFVLYFLYNSSIENSLENFHRMFSNRSYGNRDESGIFVIYQFLSQIKSIVGANAYIIAIFTVIAFVLSFCSNPIAYKILNVVGNVIVILTMISMTVMIVKTNVINYICIPVALVGPIIWCMNGRKSNVCILVYVLGLFEAFAIQMGSNNEIAGASYGLFLSSVAVMLYIGIINKTREVTWISENDRYKWINKGIGIIVCIILVISLFYLRMNSVYRDGQIFELTDKLESGPGKGIYTTHIAKEQYEGICEEIRLYLPENGTVLFSRLLPFGYLMSDLQPAATSTFRSEIASVSLEEYYKLHPDMIPSCVFVVNEDIGIANDNNPIEGYLGELLLSGEYNVIELEYSTVYLRK